MKPGRNLWYQLRICILHTWIAGLQLDTVQYQRKQEKYAAANIDKWLLNLLWQPTCWYQISVHHLLQCFAFIRNMIKNPWMEANRSDSKIAHNTCRGSGSSKTSGSCRNSWHLSISWQQWLFFAFPKRFLEQSSHLHLQMKEVTKAFGYLQIKYLVQGPYWQSTNC